MDYLVYINHRMRDLNTNQESTMSNDTLTTRRMTIKTNMVSDMHIAGTIITITNKYRGQLVELTHDHAVYEFPTQKLARQANTEISGHYKDLEISLTLSTEVQSKTEYGVGTYYQVAHIGTAKDGSIITWSCVVDRQTNNSHFNTFQEANEAMFRARKINQKYAEDNDGYLQEYAIQRFDTQSYLYL